MLLVSPLVDAASEQVDWIKAARACGIRIGGLHRQLGQPDEQGSAAHRARSRHRLERGAEARGARVPLHSGQQDRGDRRAAVRRWFVKQVTRDRAGVLRARRPAATRGPFLLFTGSSSFISESRAEVAFVRRWIAALRASGDPALRDINILVRPHPYNCHAWDPDPLTDLPGARVLSARAATTRSTPTTAPTSSTRSITRRRSSASTPAR